MNKNALLFIGLYVFWVVLSERLTLESLLVGIAVCLFVIFFNREKGTSKGGALTIGKAFLALKIVLILLKEIVISNIQVAKIVLSKNIKIQPQTFQYRTPLKSEKLRVVLANTITLTPGTITLDMDEDLLTIHALTEDNKAGVPGSQIEKLLIEMEGK